MDAKKMGQFIAGLRKEKHMTQADLAKKLHVTDKAVSRWERGLGFPDIHTIEPLAKALDVSILEIMKSERIQEPVAKTEAAAVYNGTMDIISSRSRKKKRLLIGSVIAAAVILLLICYYPLPLAQQIEPNQELIILLSEFTIENGEPDIELSNYVIKPSSMEYIAFTKTLQSYSCRRTLDSLFPDKGTGFSDSSCSFSIYCGQNSLMISDSKTAGSRILIDGRSYTLCHGSRLAGKLCSELMEIVSVLEKQ